MNPSSALAMVLVDELVRCGVRDAVLCPGSRNGPLSFALRDADAAGRLRLHVRIDERGAGFLALGLAVRSDRPVPVVCTSGTAAANLHPAALEADHAGVPLLLITADRPPELVGTGANQTVRQAGLYGPAVRLAVTLGVAERRAGQNVPWRSAVCRAVAAATRDEPGPVHLNVPLREPLVPDADPEWPEPLTGRHGDRPWTSLPAPMAVAVETSAPAALAEPDEGWELAPRTLVVAGHGGPPVPDWLAALPRVAEPGSPLWGGSLAAGPWLVGTDVARPGHVVVVGRPTLHRPVQRLLADPAVKVTVLSGRPQWTDVAGTVSAVRRIAPSRPPAGVEFDERWARALRAADAAVVKAVQGELDAASWPAGPVAARDVVAALPAGSLLVLGSSNPVRDVALAAEPRADLIVHANRGVAGIDGTVSTAVGAALAHGRQSYALLGDLTFLHDANGLIVGPGEPRPDLTIVVLNDDGGGIFALLEPGAPEHSAAFERVFATPHGVRLQALCAATATPYVLAGALSELADALRPAPGVRVVEVRADRSGLRDLHVRLRAAAAAALTD